jgi:hypothetical protein
MARPSLQLEAKATVKLGSFRGRALLDLSLDRLRLVVTLAYKRPISSMGPIIAYRLFPLFLIANCELQMRLARVDYFITRRDWVGL